MLQLPYEQASSLNVGEVFVHHQTLYLLWRLKRGKEGEGWEEEREEEGRWG